MLPGLTEGSESQRLPGAAAGMLRAPGGGIGSGRGRMARIGASEERNLNFSLNLLQLELDS
jgi:hypothetical protein